MGYHRLGVVDIYELVRRYHDGASISKISERLSLARKTVRRYLRKAEEAALSWEEPLPQREKLLDLLRPLLPDPSRACPAQEQFEDHWPELRELVTRETGPLKPKSAFGIVQQKYSLTASYSSFKRFWRSKREELGEADPALTCRFEVDPGEEVQIDYGRMGLIYDRVEKRNRTVYAFIATLSHSRFTFVELTYSQDQKSFVGSNVRMVEFFGGVPRRVVALPHQLSYRSRGVASSPILPAAVP
ncbi:putative transposase [Salinibacter ruber M8]|uniref:Transposase n=1 Tax=Salinibacter ruber (strain M8) TaxID=761659 RepID=D5H6K6_SALRM|nr:putative transposase [Salinibacter ruber M8]